MTDSYWRQYNPNFVDDEIDDEDSWEEDWNLS
jgi:hypothetical protein